MKSCTGIMGMANGQSGTLPRRTSRLEGPALHGGFRRAWARHSSAAVHPRQAGIAGRALDGGCLRFRTDCPLAGAYGRKWSAAKAPVTFEDLGPDKADWIQ
jgi:hypothetical protein